MIGAEELSQFLDYLSTERGLSPHTVAAYRRDLDAFLLHCRAKRWDPADLTLRNLRHYVGHLRRQELAQRSIARKASAVRQFFQFLLREGRLRQDPSELLAVQVRERRLPEYLSEKEIFALIEAAPGDTEASVRDRTMLELWYATGCRVSELAHLKISHIDWTGAVVRVLGKGSRERLVPLGQDALEWCARYRDIRHEWVRRHNLKDADTFFLTRRGTAFTRQGMWKLLKRYAKAAGIGRNVWPHMIRHSFATHVLHGGADLRAVQELLGHKSISTTEVYTHLDPENLKLMQLKYHPRG